MPQLTAKRVNHYGDCAEVTLTSANAELIAFCFPGEVSEGDRVPNLLYAFDSSVQAAYLMDWPEDKKLLAGAERLERIGPSGYRGCGRVVDEQAGLVEVFGFVIQFEEVPWDGPVEFECMRIDF
ncbi:MAG TPA: hypothetical protein VEY92_07295 [Pseudoxanthomonas sp.]|nr:hypothetical protein [Pseudoxanthomonas sp.]